MIAIIDVCGNNLSSICNALERLGFGYQLTHDPEVIEQASHVIIPGVGSAKIGMQALINYDLVDVIRQIKQPLLGICLGMQLLLEYSEEGDVDCLGIIPGVARRLQARANYPVPHMGWNNLEWTRETPLNKGLSARAYVYFVHSYALIKESLAVNELASCQYSERFSAIIQQGNRYGMQFHPEKSAETGITLLRNFLQLES